MITESSAGGASSDCAPASLDEVLSRVKTIVKDDEFARGVLLMLGTADNIERFIGYLDCADAEGDDVTPSMVARVATIIRNMSEGDR